jgi:hypothetical protein
MAKAAKKSVATSSSRGRAQDRAKVAGGQDYEVAYEAEKTGTSSAAVKKAIKKVGNSREAVNTAVAKKSSKK